MSLRFPPSYSNFYSILYYKAVIWLTPELSAVIKHEKISDKHVPIGEGFETAQPVQKGFFFC